MLYVNEIILLFVKICFFWFYSGIENRVYVFSDSDSDLDIFLFVFVLKKK